MSETAWEMDDPQIPDSEDLYRRIPKNPDHRTFNAEEGTWVPSAGAFRRLKGEGMSVHMGSILEERGRATDSLYEASRYAAVRFPVGAVRRAGAGVLATTPTLEEEPDEDLRAAHAEARPPTYERNRALWSEVVNEIIQASEWVDQRSA